MIHCQMKKKKPFVKCMREKYKGHIVANPKIDEFLEGLERDHGITVEKAVGNECHCGVSAKQT